MNLDPISCYRALTARDPRFDGVFFVAVTTTSVYCRPVCRAQLPGPDRCRYYKSAAEAEANGYRPCLRCRPERAPGRALVDATSRLATRAAERISAGALNGKRIDDLAAELHVGPRQLRRAVKRAYGVPPVQLAQTHRLLTAKRLLAETDLPLIEVAYASGFSSVRRFNALFRERYDLAPRKFRRGASAAEDGSFQVALEYRPPFDWEALLRFLGRRAIKGVEAVDANRYMRTLVVDGRSGWIVAEKGRGRADPITVLASLDFLPALMPLLSRLKHLFDVDAEPQVVATHLSETERLAAAVAANPGLRVPGAVDGFELGLRAILGQQVSVQAATTISARFAEALCEHANAPPPLRFLPIAADRVLEAGVSRIAGLGVPKKRAECIIGLAEAVAERGLLLEPGVDLACTLEHLQSLPGIGSWTCQYIAMRALHWPDAFPHNDLALRNALGGLSATRLHELAEAWRPWRAYGAMHLWHSRTPDSQQRIQSHQTPTQEE